MLIRQTPAPKKPSSHWEKIILFYAAFGMTAIAGTAIATAPKADATSSKPAITQASARLQEDDPGWDCTKRGNKICGPTTSSEAREAADAPLSTTITTAVPVTTTAVPVTTTTAAPTTTEAPTTTAAPTTTTADPMIKWADKNALAVAMGLQGISDILSNIASAASNGDVVMLRVACKDLSDTLRGSNTLDSPNEELNASYEEAMGWFKSAGTYCLGGDYARTADAMSKGIAALATVAGILSGYQW